MSDELLEQSEQFLRDHRRGIHPSIAELLKHVSPEKREQWRKHGELQDDWHALEAIIAEQLIYGPNRDGTITDGTRHYVPLERPEARRVPLRSIHTGLTYRSEQAAREHWGDLAPETLTAYRDVLEWADDRGRAIMPADRAQDLGGVSPTHDRAVPTRGFHLVRRRGYAV